MAPVRSLDPSHSRELVPIPAGIDFGFADDAASLDDLRMHVLREAVLFKLNQLPDSPALDSDAASQPSTTNSAAAFLSTAEAGHSPRAAGGVDTPAAEVENTPSPLIQQQEPTPRPASVDGVA